MLFALLATTLARSAEPGALPDGAQSVYLGGAFETASRFRTADSADPIEAERANAARLDIEYGAGLTRRFSVEARVPVVYALADEGPAPTICGEAPETCEALIALGVVDFAGRVQALADPFVLSFALHVGGDPWNAGARGRPTSPGEGTVDVQPEVAAGRAFSLGGTAIGLTGRGGYALRFGRVVEGSAGPFRAPGDEARWAGALVVAPPGRFSVEAGASGAWRLWGLDWDEAYAEEYLPNDDRWAVLWTRRVAADARIAVVLPRESSLHVGASRFVAARNGYADATEITVGLRHLYGVEAKAAAH